MSDVDKFGDVWEGQGKSSARMEEKEEFGKIEIKPTLEHWNNWNNNHHLHGMKPGRVIIDGTTHPLAACAHDLERTYD